MCRSENRRSNARICRHWPASPPVRPGRASRGPRRRAFQWAILIQPYLDAARKNPEDHGSIKPFTEDAIDVILSRSDGKPRDLLRKSFALIDQGATRNWDEVTGARAADILDSLSFADDDYVAPTGITRAPLEEQWT